MGARALVSSEKSSLAFLRSERMKQLLLLIGPVAGKFILDNPPFGLCGKVPLKFCDAGRVNLRICYWLQSVQVLGSINFACISRTWERSAFNASSLNSPSWLCSIANSFILRPLAARESDRQRGGAHPLRPPWAQ